MTGHGGREDRARRMQKIQAECKGQTTNRSPEAQSAFGAWLATLPPSTTRQQKMSAQVRAKIDTGFVDGAIDPPSRAPDGQ